MFLYQGQRVGISKGVKILWGTIQVIQGDGKFTLLRDNGVVLNCCEGQVAVAL